jgi:hypothetical protein
MKEELVKKIGEAGREMLWMRLFETLVDGMLVFLACALALTLVGVNMVYGVVPASVYFLSALFRGAMKSDTLGAMEEGHGELRERLKTAYQNRGQDKSNLIVEQLLSDVSGEIDNVESSAFFDSRKTSWKVSASILLVFLILLVTVIDLRGMLSNTLNLDDLTRQLKNAMKERGIEYERITGGEERWEESNLTTEKEDEKLGAEPGGERPGFNMGPVPGGGGGVGSDDSSKIYGDASSAAIEGEKVELKLRPDYGGDTEIKDDNRDSPTKIVEKPVNVESAEACDECAIGPEYEDLVRRYFEKIVGEV